MRFEKSTQIEEDFYSGSLEQDVAVKGSVTVKVNQTGKQTRMG